MAIRTLVISSRFDVAVNAHNCQANANHRLQGGHKRLKVKNGRSWDHYCGVCAVAIIERDIQKLSALKRQFE